MVLLPFKSEMATVRSKAACAVNTLGSSRGEGWDRIDVPLGVWERENRVVLLFFLTLCQVPCCAADVSGLLRVLLSSQSGQVLKENSL